MELSIEELKDELERNRYVGKQRRSQTFKIICDTGGLGRTLQEMEREPTQSTPFDLEMPNEACRAAAPQ